MMSRNDKPFDPDGAAVGEGVFGLPFSPEESAVILLPVPWEATVSYQAGTAGGPAAILEASRQVDLFDRQTGRPYASGIAMLPIPKEIEEWNRRARDAAGPIIELGGLDPIDYRAGREQDGEAPGSGSDPDGRADLRPLLREVDSLGSRMNQWVHAQSSSWLDRGRLVGVVGGDHSTPFGLIRALAERRPGLGILQIDAHADLRRAYEGFRWSHASIFRNVMEEIPGVARLVQVGVRDFSESEDAYVASQAGRIKTFFDPDLRDRAARGETWSSLVREMVEELPREIHISFDIDGLDPSLCPGTGTPVPGGLSFPEACQILAAVTASGRSVVGFDLCEVAPDAEGRTEWDANVGARILYKMIGHALLGAARTGGQRQSRRTE